MTNKTFYNEILIDHNMHPGHKHDLDDANMVMEGLNPTCGDHIWLKLKVEDGVIVDGSFVGEGCAVSQASADMMLDLIIGQKVEDAEKLADNFLKMIKGTATEEEIEFLRRGENPFESEFSDEEMEHGDIEWDLAAADEYGRTIIGWD